MFVQDAYTPEKLEAIALVEYINELSRRLRQPEIVPPSDRFIQRSPSPPPEYDKQGRRKNTREQRLRNELEVERTLAVRKALELIPDYSPPGDFNRLARMTEKYPIPVREYPQINFVGLLLGPRGNALRRMESESGARISIRGRGSVKEGSRSASVQQGQEEDLHCVVSATSYDSMQKAFALIKDVVQTATQTPEHQNDFKRLQLRELAELNGTLRDYESQLCSFCGEPGHRKVACPQRELALQSATCRNCGQPGHLMRDCMQPKSEKLPDGLQDFLADLEGQSATPELGTENSPSLVRPRATRPYVENTAKRRHVEPVPDASTHTNPTGLGSMPNQNADHHSASNRVAVNSGSNGPVSATLVAAPSGTEPPRTASLIAPPGVAPPGVAPPGVAPPGVAPPGVAPPLPSPGITPGSSVAGLAPPGVAEPPGIPPNLAPPGVAAPPPPGVPPGMFFSKAAPPPPAPNLGGSPKPPPSAWAPPSNTA